MINIEHASYYVPDHFIDLNQVPELYGLSKNELKVFTRLYGLERIPAAVGMSLQALLCKPIEQLMREKSINPNHIKVLIYAHTSKVVTPFSQSAIKYIKNYFHFDHALTFGTTINNCASTITALEMAACLLETMDADAKALIITGELTFTEVQKVIPKISILGDAAAVMLLGNSGSSHRLLATEMEIDGASADGIWMTPEQNKQYERDYAPKFSAVIKRALAKANIDISELSFIFPHNVNLPSWNKVVTYLNTTTDKIYLRNVKRYSHCFGADIVINLVDAKKENLIKPGDYYLMATVGLGSVYAAAVFQY